VSDGSLIRTLSGHTDDVYSVAFSPDAEVLASGSRDNTIKLWRVPNGSLIRTLTGHTDWVYSVAFSPGGQMLGSGSRDDTIKLWRVSDGSLIRTLREHSDWILSVAFSPDGEMLASGSADATIKLWRVSDGSLSRTLTGHTVDVRSVTFSPDGQLLASGAGGYPDYRGDIKLWRVSDGSLLQTYDQETGVVVMSIAFSPDPAGGDLFGFARWDATVVMARNPFGGAWCQYKLKKDSKARRGCEACPRMGDIVASPQSCKKKNDCDKKLKGKIDCPGGGHGFCKKIKGKRTGCE